MTAGGVRKDRAVVAGFGRLDTEGTVSYVLDGSAIDGRPGLIGMTGSEWTWYHARTARNKYARQNIVVK